MVAPEPYFDEDGITLYCGDCRDVLSGLNLSAAVVITDPPYGSGYYESDTDVFGGGLLKRFVGWGPTAIYGWPERLVGLCVAADLMPDEWVTWAPTNGRMRGFNRQGLWRESEHIAVFGKGDWGALKQPRVKTTTPMPRRGSRTAEGDGGARMGDVWREPSPNLNPRQYHNRLHPNEKLVVHGARLILALSKPGDLIVDPFAGSGPFLAAARNLGRRAVGIEIEEKHCATAVERLSSENLLGLVA